MKKIGQVLSEIDAAINKVAFVPAPTQQGGQSATGDPQAGQAAEGGGEMEALLSQLPPEVAQQIQQLPPEQQEQALMQMMQQMGEGDAQGGGAEGATEQQGQQERIQSSGPPTDLANSTLTLRVRDLLDLVSGGKATQSTLKVQEHIQKGQMRQQQMQQKAVQDQQKRQQQDALKQQQQQQEAAMAGSGPNMMGGGGVY